MIKRRDYRMLHQEDGLAAASSDDSSSSSDDDDNVASRRPSSHPPPPLTLRPSQPLSHRSHPPSLCLRLSPPASTEEDQEVQGGGGDSEEGESGRGESESDSEESEEEGGGAVGVSSQWEELVSEEEREREEEKRRKKRRKKGRKSGSSDSDSSTSDDSSDGGEEGEEDGEEDEEEEGEEGEERGEEEGGKAGKRKRKGQREGEAFKDMDFGEGGEMVVRVVGQGGGGVLRCRVCPRVLCVNSDNMKKHLASKKHVAAVGRHERGELQVVVNSDGEVEAIGETHAEPESATPKAIDRPFFISLPISPSIPKSYFLSSVSPPQVPLADYAAEIASHKAIDYAAETATHKAIEVSSKALRDAQATGEAPPTLVIAADTVVEIDGELLEKPVSKEDAIRMLLLLSGRKHRVFTGVALVLPAVTDPLIGRSPLLRSFHECTQVEFASLSQAEVEAYVATGEPMDKAGGYGIQGLGGCLVKAINGCYFNVMGLPLNR
ncbi:unnamed protein product [Closterium sp. NIES-65]|nr:unnamed protein product [Closterium sp. NIES-65]